MEFSSSILCIMSIKLSIEFAVNITDATYNLLMENKIDYTLTCDVIPAMDTETIYFGATLWFKDGVKAEDVSPRHIVNESTLNIRKAGTFDFSYSFILSRLKKKTVL